MIRSSDPGVEPGSGEKLFCFTVDVDWIPGSGPGLELLLDFCGNRGLPLTLFVTGRWAGENASLLRRAAAVSEIGSHGWEHGLDPLENFRLASLREQRYRIARATQMIEEACGIRPRCFRAPFLSIGEITLQVLEELDYRLDSSVPARRFDFGLGNVNYLEYFRAPLSPYHPSRRDLGRRGGSPLTEVPPSACLGPLNMKVLFKLGLRTIRWVVNGLSAMTSLLVFYAHAYEFVDPARLSFPPSRSHWYGWADPGHLHLLSGFIDYVLQQGYRPVLLSDLADDRLHRETAKLLEHPPFRAPCANG
jgi:peptidoglycan-N-acetylglucosamine deacetylase